MLWSKFTFALAILLATGLVCARAAEKNQTSVRRLDGTTISAAEIDSTVARLMQAGHVPGLDLAILNHGRVAYEKSYGYRDVGEKLPLTPDTVMYAASFSKSAFATMVMQLVEEGTLDLDKPIQQYLPKPLAEYPNYKDLAGDARTQLITARMLLDHTSGFPNWRWFNDDRKLNFLFTPGKRFAYSGEGMFLLQLVIETITGKPLDELMRERIFKPFDMPRSSMVWQPQFDANFANGYDEAGKSLGQKRRSKPNAAGSMVTTLDDFSHFLEAVMEGRGMKPQTRALMFSPQIRIHSRHEFPTTSTETTHANDSMRLSYGLGWGLFWTPKGKAFFKEGHDDGWNNYLVCFEQSKTCMLMMANSSNGEGIFVPLLEKLIRDTYTPVEWERYTPYDQR